MESNINSENTNTFFRKVFLWMFLGLLVTFGTAFSLATVGYTLFVNLLTTIPFAFIGIIILELILVFVLGMFIQKIPSQVAIILFLFYAFLSGVTFTAILLVFEFSSVLFVFGITAGLFAILAFIGYATKADLSSLGLILVVALFGVIIATIVNVFLQNPLFDLIITIIAIIVFMGLTAYDMQKLKKMIEGVLSQDEINKLAIYGALNLYLDFINLFINLLKLLGRRD